MKKKTGNPAARPHGTLVVGPDAADRDPIHGAALVLLATRIRKAHGLDIRLCSTACGWSAKLHDGGNEYLLTSGANYRFASDLLRSIEIIARTLLPGGVRVID